MGLGATPWCTKATAATVAFWAPVRLWMALTGKKLIIYQMRILYFLQRSELIVMTMISFKIALIYQIVTLLQHCIVIVDCT